MTKADPNYLDLDAVAPNAVKVTVGYKGKDHPLVPVSVDDFIWNVQMLKQVDIAASPDDQAKLVKELLNRAFPSMTLEILGSMTLEQMNAVMEFAHKHNGQRGGEQEAAAEGNPQKAG